MQESVRACCAWKKIWNVAGVEVFCVPSPAFFLAVFPRTEFLSDTSNRTKRPRICHLTPRRELRLSNLKSDDMKVAEIPGGRVIALVFLQGSDVL